MLRRLYRRNPEDSMFLRKQWWKLLVRNWDPARHASESAASVPDNKELSTQMLVVLRSRDHELGKLRCIF